MAKITLTICLCALYQAVIIPAMGLTRYFASRLMKGPGWIKLATELVANQIKSSFIYKAHLKAIFGRAKVLYM